MIKGMFDHGAIPVLERVIQFTGARHKVLVNDIANLDTPFFKPRDLDPDQFQSQLRDAIEHRRQHGGRLNLDDTDQLRFTDHGIEIKPAATYSNILFHDRNNRNLERVMEHLAENTMAHNAAIQLLKSEFDILRVAIRGRI